MNIEEIYLHGGEPMKESKLSYYLTVLGLACSAVGLWLVKAYQNDNNIGAYLCIGFGCGIFGHGVGELFTRYSKRHSPEISAQQLEIEETMSAILRFAAVPKRKRIT